MKRPKVKHDPATAAALAKQREADAAARVAKQEAARRMAEAEEEARNGEARRRKREEDEWRAREQQAYTDAAALRVAIENPHCGHGSHRHTTMMVRLGNRWDSWKAPLRHAPHEDRKDKPPREVRVVARRGVNPLLIAAIVSGWGR